VGGVQCAEGQFVDDMYIGQCIARAGFKNVMVSYPLRIVTGGLGPRQFIRVFRRWMLFSTGGLPASFTRPNWLRGALYFTALIATGVALATGNWVGALVAFSTKLNRRVDWRGRSYTLDASAKLTGSSGHSSA
jgi:ceramide glucosyltransferase